MFTFLLTERFSKTSLLESKRYSYQAAVVYKNTSVLSVQKAYDILGDIRYYYVIRLDIKVIKPLEKSNLVYELGIARKSVIGENVVVEGEKFAWPMIGAYHVDCDFICLHVHIAHNNHLLYHEVLLKNETGSANDREFGFLPDTEFSQWKVFDHKIEKEICVVESVDCSEFLYPVVAGYNPNFVVVTATFMDE